MKLTETCPTCKGSAWITSEAEQRKWDEWHEEQNRCIMSAELEDLEKYNQMLLEGPPIVGRSCSRCRGKGYVLTNDGKELKKLKEAIVDLKNEIRGRDETKAG